MDNKIKKGLLAFLLIVFLLPFIQYNLPFITSGALKGFNDYAPDIDFSLEKWFNGSYQSAKSKYYNDHIGFRADMVRINNQIRFSLFRKITGKFILGRENCMFVDSYINEYTGADFAGEKAIRERMLKLKVVSDTLLRSGKSLILVYAPNKAYYYPEYIPAMYIHQRKGKTNLQVFKQTGDSLGINQIDFNEWFLTLKNTSKELLFSKSGIHWTSYAAFLAGDSLLRCIENLRNIRMPHPVLNSIIHTTQPRNADVDIGDMQNLVFPATTETFSYPDYTYVAYPTTSKPRIVFIGDSFVFNLMENNILQNTTTGWQFWFYFAYLFNAKNSVYNADNTLKDHCDWKKEISKSDCIVLLYTSINLTHLGDGFIEQAYDYYFPEK